MTDENGRTDEERTGPEAGASGEASKTRVAFADMDLRPEVLQAIADMGFTEAMEVQTATLGPIRTGRDLMVQSRTGSGKTAAFGIPLVDRIVNGDERFVQAIILLPTRELALQVAAEVARVAAKTNVQVVPVYGGAPMGRQVEQLKAGAQLVCGTPGRILDHLRRGTLKLDRVRCAVLDECDEMLSMGFQEDIEAILEHTPAERQTLLFSATVPDGIQRLSRRFMRDPQVIKLSADFVGVHEIRHVYYSIPGGAREAELNRILAFENPERAIIFCNTREETSRLAEYLRKQGYDAEAISSDLSQSDRERVMARMRAGGIRFLVATDVAARGIDLENLPAVINYTIPESPEIYIHRTGRTGRAGKHGTAISLIGPTEVGSFYYIKLLYKIKPEERSLPSEAEIRSRREGERVTQLRALHAGDPGPQWRSLARRLMGASDGERLIGALLAAALEEQPPAAVRTERPAVRAESPRGDRGSARGDRSAEAARSLELREAARDGREPAREVREPPREGREFGREGREFGREGREPGREGREPRRGREPAREGRDPARDSREGRESPREGRGEPPREGRGEPPRESREGREPPREGREPPREGREPPREGREPPREPIEGREPPREPVEGHEPPREPIEGREPPREREGGEPPRDGRDPHDSRERFRGRDDRGAPRRDGGRGGRGERDRRPRANGGPPRPAGAGGETREFWEVWSEEAGRAGVPPVGGETPPDASVVEVETLEAPESPPPRMRREEGPGQARLYLNLGRKDGASDADVATLLAAQGMTIPAADIDVMNTHTYINVEAGEAERLCAALSGQEHGGRTLLCERARPPRRR